MSYSESQQHRPVEQPQSVLKDDLETDQKSATSSRRPRRRWLLPVGLMLLLLGGGLGWRWWQSSQSGNVQGGPAAMGGMPAIPVRLETAKTSTVQETSEFVGALESRRSVVLNPEIVGRVSQIFVQAGDRVSAGTPLVQLSPEKRQAELAGVLAGVNSARATRNTAQSQLQALQAERLAQVAEVELQQEQYRRISVVVREGAFAQTRLDQVTRDLKQAQAQLNAIDQRIKASRASLAESEAGLQQSQAQADLAAEQLQDTTVVAPFDGIVGDIPVRLGQLVSTTDTLTTVTQNQSLELRLSIPLERSTDLQIGQRVELVDRQGKALDRGRISFIAPQVNSNAQSILAKATFDNPQGRLRDGQFVRARVIWQESPGILIPTAAVTRVAGEPFVYLARSPKDIPPPKNPSPTGGTSPAQSGQPPSLVAYQQPVKLGVIQGNRYQVIEGLKPGDQVIVSGILNLTDGAPIMPER